MLASTSITMDDPSSSSLANDVTIEDATIPTTIVALEDQDSSNTRSNISNQQKQSRHTATLALDVTERQLFDTLVQTVHAYNRMRTNENGNEEFNHYDNQKQTEQQQREANVVNNYHHHHHHSSYSSSALEIRVAGGWVRDKLLGLQTHDVDIAVNHLSGVQFATLVQEYVNNNHIICNNKNNNSSNEQPVTQPNQTSTCGRMGVIAANPEQSKHLETATMRVCGISVDFCNLRSVQEIYHDHSRIPTVKSIGTPYEDALRRDFTMNALFYNLVTRSVEDWTGRGLQDLRAGKLVTPLPALQTFRDDPLRVLRAIRFAVRYQFDLDDDIEQAAMDLEIHKALHIKVSRERVGKELEGMLTGKGGKPIAALQLISKLKLAGSVLSLPRKEGNIQRVFGRILQQDYAQFPDDDCEGARHLRELGWQESSVTLDLLPPLQEPFQALQSCTTTKIDHRLLPMAVFLLPFRQLQYEEHKRPDKPILAASYVFREGIKFKNKDVQAITTLMEMVDPMAKLLEEAAKSSSPTANTNDDNSTPSSIPARTASPLTCCRLQAGLLLRASKELWLSCLLLATVEKIRQAQRKNRKDDFVDVADHWTRIALNVYNSIVSLQLDECWKVRPLLDGKAVIEALDLPKGPEVAAYLNEQMKWMLLNPRGTPEECKAHLQSFKRSRSRLSLQSFATGGSSDDNNAERSVVSAADGSDNDTSDNHRGLSDGTGVTVSASSPAILQVDDSANDRHFSKKMHVESMDIT